MGSINSMGLMIVLIVAMSSDTSATPEISDGDLDKMSFNISIYPEDTLYIFTDETSQITINVTCLGCDHGTFWLTMSTEKAYVTTVSSAHPIELLLAGQQTHSVTVNVTGHFLGISNLILSVWENETLDFTAQRNRSRNPVNNSPGIENTTENVFQFTQYIIRVKKAQTAADTIFLFLIAIAVFLTTITFGCELDLDIVKGYLKKPVGIIIGQVCQYGLMPTVAYTSAVVSGIESNYAYGLLAYGCSPGGGASNIWTVILGGDINLSITMTFASLFTSLAFMPLWMYTAGKRFARDLEVEIPFTNILLSLALLIAPCLIGIFTKKFRPKWALKIIKVVRPITIAAVLGIFGFGIYVNLYLFKLMWLMGSELILPAMFLPYTGMLVSLIMALVLCQTWKTAKTISIETGIQNMGIAMVLVRLSLTSPDAELSMVPAVLAGFSTPWVLISAALIRKIFMLVQERRKNSQKDIEDTKEISITDLNKQ